MILSSTISIVNAARCFDDYLMPRNVLDVELGHYHAIVGYGETIFLGGGIVADTGIIGRDPSNRFNEQRNVGLITCMNIN